MAKPIILVVEDDRPYADMIAEQVRETHRYEALTAYSAKEGLALIAKHQRMLDIQPNRIRCILLDIKMPEMDGLAFLETIRKEMSHPVPVIIVSAWEDEEKWRKATANQVVSYLRKPYKKEDLLARIDRALNHETEEMKGETESDYIDKKLKGEIS